MVRVRVEEHQRPQNGRFNIIFTWNDIDTAAGVDTKEAIVEGLTYIQIERLAKTLLSFQKNFMSSLEIALGTD